MRALLRSRPGGGTFHIEDVQDQVELGLMRGGHHEVARAYVLYRERRAQERAQAGRRAGRRAEPVLMVTDRGQRVPLDSARAAGADRVGLRRPGRRRQARADPGRDAAQPVRRRADRRGHKAAILAARTLIEKDPGYTRATARLLLHTIRTRDPRRGAAAGGDGDALRRVLPAVHQEGRRRPSCSTRSCCSSTWRRLGAALKAERDLQFDYLGLQTLYDRYFLHIDEARIELPQAFFMRVAMGLALNEIDREARAIEFYEVLSSFDFMSSARRRCSTPARGARSCRAAT